LIVESHHVKYFLEEISYIASLDQRDEGNIDNLISEAGSWPLLSKVRTSLGITIRLKILMWLHHFLWTDHSTKHSTFDPRHLSDTQNPSTIKGQTREADERSDGYSHF
jgi:hypothetical protein